MAWQPSCSIVQTYNTPSTEGSEWNLMKLGPAVLEKKTFKDHTTLNMYIGLEKGRITPGGTKF